MNRLTALLVVLWALIAVPIPLRAAAPPPKPEPLKGVVLADKVLCCAIKHDGITLISFWFQPLQGGRAVEAGPLCTPGGLPLRWHAGHGALWVAESRGDINDFGSQCAVDIEWSFELAELFKGRTVVGPGAQPDDLIWSYFTGPDAVSDARFLGGFAEFRPWVEYDYLATARDAMKLFVITNVGSRTTPAGKGGSVVARAFSRNVKHKWSFICYSVRAHWNRKKKEWIAQEREECSIELGIREPFQALARGEDYYFLTASGKLYRAPKPAKGKHRKLEKVWDDKRAPIKAYISDADRGRTFLFCDSGPKGVGKPCVFELASGVRLRFYDRALFKPGKQGPDRLRQVVGYSRVLLALKLIKEPPVTPQGRGNA
jgi:hypothetical protein